MIKRLIDFFSSLKLTIFNFAVLMIMVFAATMEQTDAGIFFVKKRYFESPFGYLIGILIFVNLIAAHVVSFKLKWRKIGIWLIHLGVIVLVVGAGLTSCTAVESQMAIQEGQTKHYSESTTTSELAVTLADETQDKVIAFPETYLKKDEIRHSDLPFRMKVLAYFPNSRLDFGEGSQATQGFGTQLRLTAAPLIKKDDYRNMASAYVEILDKDTSLGVWMLSSWLKAPQLVHVGGKTYRVAVRPARYYNDYSITLLDFRHDIYPGTDIPKNFSSEVLLKDPTTKEERKERIYMNHPLRYKGKTFYQASFGKNDTMSVFQVVENRGWLFPYISSALVSLGLLIHFGLLLVRHLRKTWA